MKRMVMVAIVFAVALAFTASDAQAIPLAVGDQYYLGFYTPPEPASLSNEAGYIDHLLSLEPGYSKTVGSYTFSRSDSTLDATGFPSAVLTGAEKVEFCDPENQTCTPTFYKYDGRELDVSGFTYIIGKYDGTQAGGYVWYVKDLTTVTLPVKLGNFLAPSDQRTFDISHYSLFNPTTHVPDGGTTLMLLGGALLGLEGLRRRFRA